MDSPTLKLTKELIKAQSITPLDAGCQDLMRDRLSVLDFEIEELNFSDGHGEVRNFWARRNNTSPCVVFAGHTDVVPTGNLAHWSSPPFEPTERDGCLYGRGTADMKTSLAAFITACESFVAQYPDHAGSIAFLITSDEEGPATCGTRKVIETLQQRGEHFEYCIVGEPSSSERLGDVIKNGRRGSFGGLLTVIGKQGHIAYPHLADNPIHLCGTVIQELCSIEWDQGNDYFPPTSLQISNINGGTGATNVIPGDVEIMFNLRFSTEITALEIEQKVKSSLNDLGIEYRLDWTLHGEPFLTEEGALVEACQNAIERVTGHRAHLSTSGGTSDGRFIAPTGAQIVELGPINKSIHQIDEHVDLATPDALSMIYQTILQELLVDA